VEEVNFHYNNKYTTKKVVIYRILLNGQIKGRIFDTFCLYLFIPKDV